MAKKIIVPKEHQQIIIDLYVNKQHGIQRVIKELRKIDLPYGQRTIKNVLRNNNVHIRNLSESQIGKHRIEVPQELQEEIIDLYNRGYGLEKIVQILNTSFSFDKVRSILRDNGVHIRTVQQAAQVKIMPDLRKYSINDNYNFQSHNGAWILGMFASDGYLPITKGAKNRMVLTLQGRDEECLKLIKKELNYTGPIHQYKTTTGYDNSSLAFTSSKIREEFQSFGIINAKTFKLLHLPEKLDKKYWLDYIRGYFDGDGSVYKKRDSIASSIVSANESFLKEIKQFLAEQLKLEGGCISKNHDIYQLGYSKKDSLKLCSAFYQNDYLALPRKKNKYFALR